MTEFQQTVRHAVEETTAHPVDPATYALQKAEETERRLALEIQMNRLVDENRRARALAGETRELQERLDQLLNPQPFSAWHEDVGCVLWWAMPICEAPYCGGPDCSDWPFSGEHEPVLFWTPIDGNEVQHRFDAMQAKQS